MKWLTNIQRRRTLVDYRTSEEDTEFLKGKVIGPPQGTATYTADQLREMGMVGVYLPDPVPESDR